METARKNLRRTVSRRIFLLFLLCALIPISAHSLFSFFQVRRQLIDQSRKQLADQNRNISASVAERLMLLVDDLTVIAGRLRDLPPAAIEQSLLNSGGALNSRFTELSFLPGPRRPADLPEGADAHLRSGKAVLTSRTGGRGAAIYLCLALDAGDLQRGLLLGEINPAFLWQPALGRMAQSEIAVLDHRGRPLFTTTAGAELFGSRSVEDLIEAHAGHFRYQAAGREYLASHRTIYLQPHFLAPPWVMTISEPMAVVLAPAAEFQRFFPLILALAVATIVLASLIRIRQTLTPVRGLQEAARRVAEGEMGYQVEIHSRDEFEALGASFNWMSGKLKENEALLLQAERLSTIGRMSAAIVHEIKQPLTAISGQLELARAHSTSPDTLARLAKIDVAVKRLFGLLDEYRVFSRRPQSSFVEISLAEVASQVHDLFEHQFLMRHVGCRLEHQPGQPLIKGDSAELQQVVTNLLTNALDAIDAREGGPRQIEMRTFAANGSVGLRIRDTGCGISQADQERIFDPFFTTKSAEQGTGLGMAVVRTILTRHAAQIEVDSRCGEGTSFTVTFPSIPVPSG